MKKLTIVIPVHNEADVLGRMHERLSSAVDMLPVATEFLFVDDGSADLSLPIIRHLSQSDARVSWISLSRNFGKEAAMTAGLDYSDGDATVIIDADLQDPPELIPNMLDAFEDGCDVVYARRTGRAGDHLARKLCASLFYRLMSWIGTTRIPVDTGDYQLFSRRAVLALRTLREQNRYMKGLFAWLGFKQRELLYERNARAAGNSKFGFAKLINFAFDAITSFSMAPLRLATGVGAVLSAVTLVYGLFILSKAALYGDPVRGYPSLMVAVLFLGGIQLLALGIIGEYVGRIYMESKGRPIYLIAEMQRGQALGAHLAKAS